jgi:hypothetical protein
MKIDWKRKLTSRKFWAAAAGFVSMLIVALGRDAETAQTVTGLIMAGASLVAYMIGEGLADSGATYNTVPMPEAAEVPDPFAGCSCDDCKITFEESDDNGVPEG